MSGGFRSRSKSGGSSLDRTPQGGKKQSSPNNHSGGNPRGDQRGRQSGRNGGHGGRGRQDGRGNQGNQGNQGGQRRQYERHDRNRAHQPADFIRNARRVGVDQPRAVVFETLLRVHKDDAFANLTLPKALRVNNLEGRDAAFATELTYGTLRAEGVLDAIIAKCSSRELDTLAVEVLDALRLGTYQLIYTR
ncbi:transcription antitermination protein NusB, partial [Corynebacterium casei]